MAYEEPENCVHPHLLESLVYIMRESNKQVILTTHSPYLLDFVKPEEVLLVKRVNGETIVEKPQGIQMEKIKKFLEEGGTLGEAWYSGLLGGEE